MGWKDLRLWIKIGIIFVFISIIFFVISLMMYLEAVKQPHNMAMFAFFYYGITTYPTFLLMRLLPLDLSSINTSIVVVFVAGILNWFLVGALIGWIVEKIKSLRKNE